MLPELRGHIAEVEDRSAVGERHVLGPVPVDGDLRGSIDLAPENNMTICAGALVVRVVAAVLAEVRQHTGDARLPVLLDAVTVAVLEHDTFDAGDADGAHQFAPAA